MRPALRSSFVLTLVAATVASLVSVASADRPRRERRRERARAASTTAVVPARQLPQDCAMDPFHADYGGLERGARVRLGRHRVVDGDAYWADAMNEFVGRITTVTGPRGVDEKGCPLIAVAVDDGEYDWRVRDLEVVAAGAVDARATVELAPGFAGDPRTFEGTIEAEESFAERAEGCSGVGTRAATLRLTLTDDFETILFLAHSEADTVLLIRTPSGETICADDVDDLDPVVSGSAAAGVYEIWVGAYDDDAEGTTFRLGISEKSSVRATDLSRMNADPIGEASNGTAP